MSIMRGSKFALILFYLLQTADYTSSQTAPNDAVLSTADSEECRVSQIHFSLGDYYVPGQNSNQSFYLYLIFHTESECQDLFLDFKINDAKSLQLSHYKLENLAKSSILDTESGFKWLHHFKIPYFEREDPISSYRYTIKGTKGLIVKEEMVIIPDKDVSRSDKQGRGFIFLGDFDSSENATDTLKYLNYIANTPSLFNSTIQFIMHLGDIAYETENKYGSKTKEFLDAISSITKTIPYMIVPGNHENIYNYYVIDKTFEMPGSINFKSHFYSFDAGLVHFVALDFDYLRNNNESRVEILKWIEEDLAKASEKTTRNTRPWVIVMSHRPLYCSNAVCFENECSKNLVEFAEIEALLLKYKVDLFINGHIHFYERMLPLSNGHIAKFFDDDSAEVDASCKSIKNKQFVCDFIEDPFAPIYITEGIAGNGIWMPSGPVKEDNTSVVVDWRPGIGYLEVFNKTHLEYSHIFTSNLEIIDKFVLIKSRDIIMNPLPIIQEDEENTLTYVVIFLAASLCIVGLLIAAKKYYFKNKESKKLLQYELSSK